MRAITWLLLLGLLSNIVCYDGPRFIDLSSIDSSVTHTFTEYKIQLKLPSNDGTITMSCAICDRNLIIKCTEDELINVAIQMKGLSQTFEVPINVTCNTKDNTKNKLVVETIDAHATANEVIFTWTLPNDTIQEYLVYFMTSSTHKSQQISTNRIYFDNLSEKTWHQICIASIDNLWRTSKFTCKKVLTDFSITGPVTNIAAISDIDTISVTWNNPQYKHDIPQGYIVHINGTTNICRTIIIHMMAVHIPTNDPCPHRQFLNWTHLQDLHIDKFPPYCQFNIDIIPFNKNKPFINKSISIQTKQGESDAVQNLQSSILGNYLYVSFKEPSSPQGRIIKYYMKISRVQMDICTNTNDVVHESNITTLYDYIHLDVVKRCGRYLIEISAMNGWSRNGGQGKTASTIFIQTKDSGKHKITCEKMFGFVREISRIGNKSDCSTRVISSVDCPKLRNIINSTSQCMETVWTKYDGWSNNFSFYFNETLQNNDQYITLTWSITTDKLVKVESVSKMETAKGGSTAELIVILLLMVVLVNVVVLIMRKYKLSNISNMLIKMKYEEMPQIILNARPYYYNSKLAGQHEIPNQNKQPELDVKSDFAPILHPKYISNSIAISNFMGRYQQFVLNESFHMENEYQNLSHETESIKISLGLTVAKAQHDDVSAKNRFKNILPFDQTRVKIRNKQFPEDYINASYIPFLDNELETEYIACQGPNESSLSDFWLMIWEESINCVVMLTKTTEDGKLKCMQYWPNCVGQNMKYGYGNQFFVNLNKEYNKGGYIERYFTLQNRKTGLDRMLVQLHMHAWSDFSAPDLDVFDQLFIRFHEISDKTMHPYLVHCSAGVGRTGTFIAIDRIIKNIINQCDDVNIYNTVLKLRQYRDLLVQRKAQYKFIYDYINHFLSKYMIRNNNEDMLYFNDNT